jgi:hypothetical protein
MSYFDPEQVVTHSCGHGCSRLIQPGGNFAGKLGGEWYVPTTLCKGQALAEVLIKQFRKTFK